MSRHAVLLALPLLLLGAGCVPPVTSDDLPKTPPASVRVIDGNGDAAQDAATAPNEPVGAATDETEADDAHANDAVLETEVVDVVGPEDGDGAAKKASADAVPYYIEYSEEEYERALAEGRPIALYFWAAWCPICRAEEPEIRAQIEALHLPIAGFRVNYDTEHEMTRRFKVPYQHTLVILDTEGNETTRFLGPVPADEREAAYAEAYGD